MDTNQPIGLRPIWHPSGQVRPRLLYNGIASGYAANIFEYQPIKLNATGTVEAVTATTDPIIGSFGGVFYQVSAGQRPIFSNVWLSGTTFTATNQTPMWVMLWDDPLTEYAIQADGSVAATAIGSQTNVSNFTSGNTTTGFSAATCSASSVSSSVQGQLRIQDAILTPDNAFGDAYTQLRVTLVNHPYVAPIAPTY